MKKIFHLMFSFSMLFSTTLNAELCIQIAQEEDSIQPIGVIPFQWTSSGSVPEDISDIVTADLRNSGKFNPLDRSLLPQQVSDVQKIQSSMWSILGLHSVIIGRIMPSSIDDSYRIVYQLVDTRNSPSTVLIENSYKAKKKWLRYVGHTISNEVFEKLTGIKGTFRTRIAYIVQTNTAQFVNELRVSDYDGHNQYTVYRSSHLLMSPTWSPDGSKLAYVTFENGRSALVIQTLSNGEVRKIVSFPCHNGAPAFSPDGTKLAFASSKTGNLNLYLMEIDSNQIRQITDSRSNNTEPAWFPDNQHLAFTSDQTGYPQVYKVNIHDGTSLHRRITWNGLRNQNANISSDGKIMVMVTTMSDQQHIAKQNLITGNVQILSSTFLDETPSLSPNGTMVIYSTFQEEKSVLNLISTNGRFKMSLLSVSPDKKIKSPSWSPFL